MQNQDMEDRSQHFVIDQIQLILAEKRTSLSVLCTALRWSPCGSHRTIELLNI
jgi:hypothetical protein